jgi:hypothetical protein
MSFFRDDVYNWHVKHELAGLAKLNAWYYSDAPLTVQPLLDAARRESTFDEVVKGWTRITRSSRLAAACLVAIASKVTTAMASAPTTP